MFQGDLERPKKPVWEIADDVLSQEGERENGTKGTDLRLGVKSWQGFWTGLKGNICGVRS